MTADENIDFANLREVYVMTERQTRNQANELLGMGVPPPFMAAALMNVAAELVRDNKIEMDWTGESPAIDLDLTPPESP